LEHAADAILAIDPSGIIQYANRAMERLTGRTRDEVLAQPLRRLLNDSRTLESLMDAWRRLGCGGSWRSVVAIQGAHGRSGEVEAAVSPIPGEAGRVAGYLLVAREVGDDRQVDNLQRRQVHTIEGIARFAGGVAHAYNNFLMTVMGYTELLRDQMPDSGNAFQEIADIKASCEEAAAFTRQLLTFSRKQVRQSACVDMNRVLSGLEGRLRQVLGDAIVLEMTPAPHPAPVRIDRDRLEHVVLDLAGYARDVQSGGAFRIGVDTVGPLVAAENSAAASKPRSWVEVRVTYAGPRLDAEARARIFEPAFPKERKGQRIDLRLATLYTMIRQSGGRIAAAGSPEGETTFTIHLPHADSSPEA
jgi:two-component system cell cycle sensor histidine kinase/response regulator CckA